jgi:hypothetical protein
MMETRHSESVLLCSPSRPWRRPDGIRSKRERVRTYFVPTVLDFRRAMRQNLAHEQA